MVTRFGIDLTRTHWSSLLQSAEKTLPLMLRHLGTPVSKTDSPGSRSTERSSPRRKFRPDQPGTPAHNGELSSSPGPILSGNPLFTLGHRHLFAEPTATPTEPLDPVTYPSRNRDSCLGLMTPIEICYQCEARTRPACANSPHEHEFPRVPPQLTLPGAAQHRSYLRLPTQG